MAARVESAPASRLLATSPDATIQGLKKTNDGMRKHIAKLKSDLEQEKNKSRKLKRDRVMDVRSVRDQEQQRAIGAITELKKKCHQEKINELLAQKEALTRQFENEIKKMVRQKEDALGKMQTELLKTKEEFLMKMKNKIAADAQEETKKKFDSERTRLLQEINDLKEGRKNLETLVNDAKEAERKRTTEVKWRHEKHLLEVDQLKKDARRDIVRLVDELKKKNKLISDLHREIGQQCGQSQKLQAEKESLKGELQTLVKMADTWDRSSPSPRQIPSPRPDALGRLSPDSQALEDFERERFHRKLAELIAFIRRLEAVNETLIKDKAVLESKAKSFNSEFTSERYKLTKQIQDLEHDKKRLEDRCKLLNEDNNKLRGSKIPIRRQDSHSPRKSPTVEMNGRLSRNSSEESSELEQLKKQADDHFKTITELKQQIIERDRRLDLMQHRRRKARRRQPAILESPMKGQEDETGLDSASIASSLSQKSDNTLSGEWDELERAELEGNYQQLSKEYLQLKKAYAQLQAMIGGSVDIQRECKLRQQLELDLLDSQAKIEDLKNIINKQGKDSGWVEEKQNLIVFNRRLQEKIKEEEENVEKVKFDLRDSKDQNELLEFRILELEERMEAAHSLGPESLTSLSPASPEKLVKRSSSSALPEIEVTESDGNALQIAVTEEGFTGMSVADIKKKLEKMGSVEDEDKLSVEDKKTLVRARAMLDIADLKLKKMTATEVSLKRKNLDLEHEKDRLAAKISSLEAELRNKLSELEESNKRVDELEDIINKMKRAEAKFRAQEDVYLNNESKLCCEISTLKKQMASAREGRNYENELLFQKIAEVKQEKEPETPQKVTALEKENSKLQEKLDRLLKEQATMASEEGADIKTKKIELKNVMTLEELEYLKSKVEQIKAAELKIAKMEQTELVLKEHIDELEQEVAELQQHIHHRKEKQDKIAQDYKDRENLLKDKLKKTKQGKEELREKLDESIARESAKEMENTELKRKLTELEQSEMSLTEKLDELEKEITCLKDTREAEAVKKDEEIIRIKSAALEMSLGDLEVELSKVKEENEDLKDKLTVFEFSEKALKEMINQLRSENELLKDERSALESENEKLKNSLPIESAADGTDMDKEDAKNEILKLRDRVWELENAEKPNLQELSEENAKLLAQVKELQSPDKVIKQQVNYLSLTDADKEELLEPMQDRLNNDGESLNNAVEELRASQDTLKDELKKTTCEKEDLLTMYKEALEKIQEYESGGRDSVADVSNEEPLVKMSVNSSVEETPIFMESIDTTESRPSFIENADFREALKMLQEIESDEEVVPATDEEADKEISDVREEPIRRDTITDESKASLGGTFVVEEPIHRGTFSASESSSDTTVDGKIAMKTTGTQFPEGNEEELLENKISELQAREDELREALSNLQSSEGVLRKENETLTSEINELNNTIKAMEEKSSAVEVELKDKEDALQELKGEIEENEKRKSEREKEKIIELQEISERLKMAEEQCIEKDETIKTIQTSESQLKEEITEVVAEKEEIEQKLLESRQELEQREKTFEDLRDSEANLTERLEEMVVEKDRLAEDLKDSNETLQERDLALESVKSELAENSGKIEKLSTERDEVLQQLKESNRSIEEQNAKELELKKIISELQDREVSLREKAAEVEEAYEKSKARVTELEKSDKESKDKIAELETSETSLRERIDELESLDEELMSNEAELEEYKNKLNESEHRAEELAAQEQILKCKMSEFDDRFVVLEGSEETLRQRAEELECELQERKALETDLNEEHLKEVNDLQDQIEQFGLHERKLRNKIAELTESELNAQESYEEAQRTWNEQERGLKERIDELETKLSKQQQTESALKKEVKKKEEFGLRVRRESADLDRSSQDRICELEESELQLQEEVSKLKLEYAEALNVWSQNEDILRERVIAYEDIEADLRSKLSDAEQKQLEVQEQLDAKVRESEVSAEMWQQSESALSEKVAELEESEGKLKAEVEELEAREMELKQELDKASVEVDSSAETSTLVYKARLQELEESENILKEKMSQVVEAEKNARDMLQEATVVYHQNEESFKEKIENLEEEQGEMQGRLHELESHKNLLDGQVEDWERRVKDLKREKRVLEERIDELEDEVFCLKENLSKSQRLLEEAGRVDKESQTHLMEQLETMQFERRANEKNLNDRIRELEEIENKNENKVYDLEAAKSLLEDQVQSLEIENKRVKEANGELNEKIDDVEDEARGLRRKVKDAEERVEELERSECELKERIRERDSLEEERKIEDEEALEQMKKRISELEMSEEMLKEEVEHMEKTGQKLKLKISEKNEDIERILLQRKKEKDELRKKIQDHEEVEMQLKEQLYVLGLDIKKKEWDMERLEPHIKFQTDQIQDASRQDLRNKELTNTLKKRIEQLENREKDLKTQLTLQEDNHAVLKEKVAKAEKREKELKAKVEKTQKSEEGLRNDIVVLKRQEEKDAKREIETLQEKVRVLENEKEEMRTDCARNEKREKNLQKLHKTLEEDFAYIQDQETKLKEKVVHLKIEQEELKKNAYAEKEQLEEKISSLEIEQKALQKKLYDAKKSEEAVQNELSTAEESFDKMEATLKQTNKALEKKTKDLEESEQKLKQRVQEVEKEDANLKQKLKKLENSESSLKKEVSDFEDNEIDLRHSVRERESAERMLKMDNDQLKLEKDLLDEKVAELKESQESALKKMDEMQKKEGHLKDDIRQLEKKETTYKDKIREMESSIALLENKSAQSAELEQELTVTQEELQEANTKIEHLERAKASLKRQLENLEDDLATGQMIRMPLEEFKQMKAQTTLLEMTEQNVEDLQKEEAMLKDKLKLVEGEKDYTDADKEILELRLQLREKDEEIEKLKTTHDSAQMHLKTAQRQVSDLRSNHTDVKKELKDLQDSIEEREAELREREIAARIQEIEDIGELKCKLQEAEEAIKEKSGQCRSLRVENTQLHSEFRDKNGQLTALKAEVMRLERLLKVNKTDEDIVSQLREELEQVQIQLSQKDEDLKTMDDSNIMYRTKLDRREKELASKEEELREKMTELQRLRNEISGLQQTNRMQQVEADSKYSELAGNYEAVRRELQGKSMELEDTTQELARLEEHLTELRNKLKGLENLVSERDILQGKLQATESALRHKTERERELFEEVAQLRSKVNEYEKLNATRDGLEESYKDIKLRFDDMEHRKREAELAVAPLKAKVSRLVRKCKERDTVIRRLAAELKQQYGGRNSELLDAVARLQSRMPDEEYNEPLTPYSTSLVGISEEPEVAARRSEVRLEGSTLRGSPATEPVRGTPSLSESAIHELSEPLWQAIESSAAPAAAVRPPADQDSDEAAMQELLDSLSTDVGDLASAGASGRSSARSRKSPGSTLQDLLSADPELARMLERGGSGRESASSLADINEDIFNSTPGRTTPRRQRQRDAAHLSQSPEDILNMHDRLRESIPTQFPVTYEPSPLLAEEASQLAEQLNGAASASYANGLPISPLLINQSAMPSLLQGSHLGYPPNVVPSAFAGLPNGSIPFVGNGASPAHLGGVDMPDLANHSLGSNGSAPLVMLQPSSVPMEGPPQPPSNFHVSRVVSSRSILLAWTPPPLDEMAKSNGAQVAGYKIYLNEKQKQLVNSAHLTKALLENVHVKNPMAFSIETVTVTGQTSRRVDTYHAGSAMSPHPTESAYSDSIADTEVSSILSDMSEPRRRNFVAVYSYNPLEHSPNDYPAYELSFKEGDIISVYGTVRSDGFYHGKLRGRKGLVPSNFVEEIHVTESKSQRKKKSRSQGSLHNGHSSTASDTPRQRSARSSRPSSGKTSRSGSKV